LKVEKAESGESVLRVRLDVSSYKPDEIKVSVKQNTLSIHAKHEEEKEDGSKVYKV